MLSRRDALDRLARLGTFTLGASAGMLRPAAAASGAGMVALVHTQAAGDGGVIDGMIVSLKRIGRERGLTTRAIYAADPANYQPILELLGEAGAAVVLTTFDEMGQPLRAVAPSYPGTRFLQIYGDPIVPTIPNVRTISYQTFQAGYLAGMCAARISRSGKVGYIGGAALADLAADVNAIVAGVRNVSATVHVSNAFVGSFQDPAKALQIANQMYDSGIDFIQAESSASDAGIVQSANAQPGRILSAGSRPEFEQGPQSVAAIMLCDFELSVYAQTTLALGRTWTAGHYRSSLQDGVIDFLPSPLFLKHGPPDAVARFRATFPEIADAKRRIIAGTLHVPFDTTL